MPQTELISDARTPAVMKLNQIFLQPSAEVCD